MRRPHRFGLNEGEYCSILLSKVKRKDSRDVPAYSRKRCECIHAPAAKKTATARVAWCFSSDESSQHGRKW